MADANEPRVAQRKARVARFFYDGNLLVDADLTLDKQASHHLSNVLRCKAGDAIVLFNGDGYNYDAVLTDTGQRGVGKRAVLSIHARTIGIPESPLRIKLVQCVSRPERMDICLRQAVELGVNCIQPVYSRHSIKVNDEKRAQKKQAHWQNIVISACEQSGRASLPVLCEALSFEQWIETQHAANQSTHPPPLNDTRFVLAPLAQVSLPQAAKAINAKTVSAPVADKIAAENQATDTQAKQLKTTLIIGPESGLDNTEIDQAIGTGAQPVNLGHRILRTETAGPACIVLLQSLLGDLQD